MTPEERRDRLRAALARELNAVSLRVFLNIMNSQRYPPEHINCRSVSDPFREVNAELDRLEAEAAAGIPTKENGDEAGSWDALEKALGADTVRKMREC